MKEIKVDSGKEIIVYTLLFPIVKIEKYSARDGYLGMSENKFEKEYFLRSIEKYLLSIVEKSNVYIDGILQTRNSIIQTIIF